MGETVTSGSTIAVVFLAVSRFITSKIVLIFLITKNIFNVELLASFIRFYEEQKKSDFIGDMTAHKMDFGDDTPRTAIFTLHSGRLETVEIDEIPMSPNANRSPVPAEIYPKSEQVSENMSSAEVLRSSMAPLGMNNSLNIQRNENNSSGLSGGISGFMQNNSAVPVDRPLFINTNMTAQQRIDIYRRLAGPPQDNEPALLFRMP